MLHRLTVSAHIRPEVLKDIAGVEGAWGADESAMAGYFTVVFDDQYLDAIMLAIDSYDAIMLERAKKSMTASVNVIRDSLIAGGFDFAIGENSYRIQSDQSDRENVIGLAIAAMGALSQGAGPGNYRWLDPNSDFGFITADNETVLMDAPTVMELYKQGLTFKGAMTFYARALKDNMLLATSIPALEAIPYNKETWPFQ